MSMDYEQSFSGIINVFGEAFLKAYKKNKVKGKTKILKFIVSFYRRWYHSAIIEDTLISPANLISELNRILGKPINTYPLVTLNSFNRASNVEVLKKVYTIETHPIIKDLEIFLESCIPDIELKENGVPLAEHIDNLLDKVSIYDPFYIEYLGLIAVKLKLLKKTISVYTNKWQLIDEYNQFFNQEPTAIFDKIVNATADISSFFINQVLPLDKRQFNQKYIIQKLKEPTTTDEIFKEIYESIGINFESIMDSDPLGSIDEFYGLIMSSTFFLGIVIDKYFYTLFGFYLKLINPEYMLPYDIADDLSYAIESFHMEDEVEVSMFAPCYNYTLTELGMNFFNVKTSSQANLTIPDNLTLDAVFKLATNKLNNQSWLDKDLEILLRKIEEPYQADTIWEIKIVLTNVKKLWIKMEVPENFTLHDLYNEVCYEFNLPTTNMYYFFADKTENPFIKYAPPYYKKRSYKSEETQLLNLAFNENHVFVLVLESIQNPLEKNSIPAKNLKFEITLLHIKPINPEKSYPRLTRESKALKEMFSEIKLPF